jgi:glycosyltransferase involved in cell wall biosynthesis
MTRNISFLIPAHNEVNFIADCIESIKYVMVFYPKIKYEIIVVDDHSQDDTRWNAIKAMADQVIYNIGQGIVKARQTGFEASKYDLLAFIDADNRLPLTWLPEALKYFDEEEVVAVTGPLKFYDMPSWFKTASRLFYIAAKISHKHLPMMQGGNYVIRRSALEAIGGFDTSFAFYGEDTRTATQLVKLGKIIYNPKMYILSSGRRFSQGGIVTTTLTYITSYFYVSLFHKPLTQKHSNYR